LRTAAAPICPRAQHGGPCSAIGANASSSRGGCGRPHEGHAQAWRELQPSHLAARRTGDKRPKISRTTIPACAMLRATETGERRTDRPPSSRYSIRVRSARLRHWWRPWRSSSRFAFISDSLCCTLASRPQRLAVTASSAAAARLHHRHHAPRCRCASRRSARHRHSSRS
jgi:hypothetical protein